jgi:hypothetical protein
MSGYSTSSPGAATEVQSPGLRGLEAESGLGDEAVDETGWRRCVVEPADVLNPRRVRGQIAWASSVNAAATRVIGGASTASS